MHAKSRTLLSLLSCTFASGALIAANTTAAPPGMTAQQIVDKNVAARGGLPAWRSLQTLVVSGKIDAGSGDSLARSQRVARGVMPSGRKAQVEAATEATKAQADKQVQLPFRLELKSPHMSRLEIDVAGKTAVQVYDGKNGWMLRPYLNRSEVEPFTAEETRNAEAGATTMKDPLIDYAANGSRIALEGMDPVEGHPAYKLKVTQANGEVKHVWIDAQSFLDVKLEGEPRRMDGRMRSVWIVQRDFRTVQGLNMPFVYETSVDGGTQAHRMVIESAAVNRPLDDSRFSKPEASAPVTPASAGSAAPAPAKS